jgi:hypothetical protein
MAVLFGEESHVHLIAIESSSTCPVLLVDLEAEPKVIARLEQVKKGEGPDAARRAMDSIDFRLKEDHTTAELLNPGLSTVIQFTGSNAEQPIEWPSINQASELYGIPIWVGGRAELSNVDLLDGEREWKCLAPRGMAISIAHHLYVTTLRVSGKGRWRKTATGAWDLERFVIEGFEPVKDNTLEQAISDLRSISAKWKSLEDPLAKLDAIRSGIPDD